MTRPLLIVALSMVVAGAATPQSAVDELLAADRAFAAASAATDLVSGLTAMFADEVAIPMPPGQFVDGKTANRSEEHTSELQSHSDLVCRLLLEKKKNNAHYRWYTSCKSDGNLGLIEHK